MVLLRPSSNFVLALKPNSFSAFVTSNIRRGWPSGLVLSHNIFPLKAVNLAIRATRSLIEISNPAPRLTGSCLLYFSAARRIPSAASSTYRNSRVGLPVPQTAIVAGWRLEVGGRGGGRRGRRGQSLKNSFIQQNHFLPAPLPSNSSLRPLRCLR